MSLRKLTRRLPDGSEMRRWGREIQGAGSDRAAAIIGANFLDQCLKATILLGLPNKEDEKFCLSLFDEFQPLHTFSAKIAIGYVLGLYGPATKANLDTIRVVRNVFAHATAPVTFLTPEIAQRVRTMTRPCRRHPMDGKTYKFVTPRDRYINFIMCVAPLLVLKIAWSGDELSSDDVPSLP